MDEHLALLAGVVDEGAHAGDVLVKTQIGVEHLHRQVDEVLFVVVGQLVGAVDDVRDARFAQARRRSRADSRLPRYRPSRSGSWVFFSPRPSRTAAITFSSMAIGVGSRLTSTVVRVGRYIKMLRELQSITIKTFTTTTCINPIFSSARYLARYRSFW